MKKRIAIFLVSIMLLMMAGCQMERKEQDTPEKNGPVFAFVSEELTEAEARELGEQIDEIDGVVGITFGSAEEALEEFKARFGNDTDLSDVDASYLRHRYVVTVEKGKADAVAKDLEKIEGIAEVKTQNES